MNAMDFTVLFGLRNRDQKLIEFLQQFGRKPGLDIDETQIAYLEYRKHGFCLYFREQDASEKGKEENREDTFTVKALMFYADKFENYKAFQGDLPLNINFSDSRTDIRNKLGKPMVEGGGEENTFFGGFWPEWDEYRQGDYKVTIQYNGKKTRVDLITMESVP
ncbi:MAG: hypothetical protein J2P21_30180 [Chloracidobacterium sp.]|nr:hypothetical protein [Chloracidobacterium sp.]